MDRRLLRLSSPQPGAPSNQSGSNDTALSRAALFAVVLVLVAGSMAASAVTSPATVSQQDQLARFALASQQPARALFWLGSADSASAQYTRARAWLQTGRTEEARRIFASIAESGRTHRGDAALALVKLALAKGDDADARSHIRTAVDLSAGRHRQEALFYQAELQRRAGQTGKAGHTLAQMQGGYWAALGYLNLAAEYSRTDQDPSRALVSLRVAEALVAEDPDAARAKDLTDRILLRAGVLSCQRGDYTKALGFLEKVRLDSYVAPRALYFDGLAHAGRDNYRAAMQAWHRARKYSLAFPGAADAWLGMARGYDQSGYLGQAGEAYLAASSAFESEQVSLKKLMDNVRQQGAYEALVKSARQDDVEWFLADSRTLTQPRMAYLLHFMEQADAQKAVARVANLERLGRELDGKQHDIGVFLQTLTDFRHRQGGERTELAGIGRRIKALAGRLQALSGHAGLNEKATGRLSRLRETLNSLREHRDALARIDRGDSRKMADERYQQLISIQTDVKTQQKRQDALRRRAGRELDKLALDFLQRQSRQIADTLDRTEQQIAHLYEHLALTGLKQGGKR